MLKSGFLKSVTVSNSPNYDHMDYLLNGEESERLYFRKIKRSDFKLWLPFHQDPSSTEHWPSDNLNPLVACQEWFETVFYRYNNHLGGMNALIAKSTGEFVGQCGLLMQQVDNIQELEIGYSMLPSYRNKGFATEAARKCKSFAFEKNLANSLIAIIPIANEPSQKVATKIGMSIDRTTLYKDITVHIFRVISQ